MAGFEKGLRIDQRSLGAGFLPPCRDAMGCGLEVGVGLQVVGWESGGVKGDESGGSIFYGGGFEDE